MQLALMSDIHANVQALDACLAHARGHGVERFAFLGDLVGYGADPVAVVERVQGLSADNALVVKGNHDALAVAPPAHIQTVGDRTAAWTHHQLSQQHRGWLDQLPMVLQYDQLLLVHASVDQPERWHYLYEKPAVNASLNSASAWPGVRYVFGGHVHLQTLFHRDPGARLQQFTPKPGVAVALGRHPQWLGTVGSVGQPRDGKPLAMYAVVDTERHQLTFYRVPYDHAAAAAAIGRAGLPAFFAERLATGA
jgi:diadenosine tetraphosphatase ApaH/serine/threonine PP2A family protein phosphatase